jgi:hypothetical protein
MGLVGRFVLRDGRPDLGVGEIVEMLGSRRLRVAFPHAEDGACGLVLGLEEVDVISDEEARGRLYLTD